MKYTHPELDTVLDTDNGCYNTLIIESQPLLLRLVTDIHEQQQGNAGDGVLSRQDTPIEPSKYSELLQTFVPFDINKKTLVTRLTASLEKQAVAPEYYEETLHLLASVESLVERLAFEYPCDIRFSKLSVSSLIRACAPAIYTEAPTLAGQLLDYMELVYTFDREKLFFTVNLRSYVSDEEMQAFVSSALSHGYHMVGIESCERPLLNNEKRVIIDRDLCVIG